MKGKKIKKTRRRKIKVHKSTAADAIELDGRKRLAGRVAVGLLVTLGLLYSLHFLRHFVFPNSDFASFLDIGRQWLRFQIPNGMKRAPLFSMITASAGRFLPGPDRYLFGTELYNAIMLPLSMVLIYIIGREFLGRAAIWVAFLAGISPWMIRMGSQPLAELTLIVLFASTVICARSHIKLAYLFAMLASMSRWDMAALIGAVAVVDLIRNRRWLRTIILTVLASIPFGLCMIITKIQLQGLTEGLHYLQILSRGMAFGLFEDLRLYWLNICSFLNTQMLHSLASGRVESFKVLNSVVFWLTAPLLAAAFITGSIMAIVRKRWEIIVMLIGAVPYVIAHSLYPYRMSRFCVPAAWVGLVIAAYGAVSFWQWFAGKPKLKLLIVVLQLAGTIVFVLWAIKIANTLKYADKQCPVIGRIAVLSSVLAVAGFFALQLVRRGRPCMGWLVVPAFLVLAVVSNAAATGFLLGDGQSGANFKRLGMWFLENAADEDRMLMTMPAFMPIYTGLPIERFEHIAGIKPEDAKDFQGFVEECRRRKVTLIAWDSRLAGRREDRYYKLWGLDRIEILAAPLRGHKVRYIGPCELIHVISEGSPKMAVYRIMPAGAE